MDFIFSKDAIGALSVAIGLYAYVPYFRALHRREIKPHVFTWFLWALMTGIGFFAQMSDNAGPGAWVTGMTAVMATFVTIAALKHGEKNITRSDWVCFFVGLTAIPLWLLTKDALLSVIIVAGIDAVAFMPTFRKSWHKPREETLQTYFCGFIVFLLSIAAMNNHSLITSIYPATMAMMNFLFIGMVLYRRRKS